VIEKDTKTHQARRLSVDVATAELLVVHRDTVVRRARMAGTEVGDESHVFSISRTGGCRGSPTASRLRSNASVSRRA
jgi:hypothetical protein